MLRPQYLQTLQTLAFKHHKMAFVSGPRQTGKTYLSKQLLKERGEGQYYNWDEIATKRLWIKNPQELLTKAVGKKPLIVFDELHKAPRWKTTLKGLYDTLDRPLDILVTGSSRLNVFRRGGDSLMGRYFLFRLHPFSVGELHGSPLSPSRLENKLSQKIKGSDPAILQRLLTFSGFPEPYLKADANFHRAWQNLRLEQLVREEIRDLSNTSRFSLLESLAALLPERVGSPLSLNSLALDLQVSHPTIKRWLDWFSQIYYLYLIRPYAKRLKNSLKKEAKIYLWDWSQVEEKGFRFENLVAGHLLKACHYWTDSGQGKFELFYLRDRQAREVDFLITQNQKPWLMAEVKLKANSPSSNLINFSRQIRPALTCQIIAQENIQEGFSVEQKTRGFLMSAHKFFSLLP